MGRRHADAWCVTARIRTKTAGLRQGLGEGTVPISVPCISAFTAPIQAVSRGTRGEDLDFHGFCINIITAALTSSLFPPLPPPPRRRWWYMAGCCRELCDCSLCGWVWCGVGCERCVGVDGRRRGARWRYRFINTAPTTWMPPLQSQAHALSASASAFACPCLLI